MPKSSTSARIRTDTCFNPFNLIPHPRIRNNRSLRKVQKKQLLAVNKQVTEESLKQRICDTCRRNLSKLPKKSEDDHESKGEKKVCMFLYFSQT